MLQTLTALLHTLTQTLIATTTTRSETENPEADEADAGGMEGADEVSLSERVATQRRFPRTCDEKRRHAQV